MSSRHVFDLPDRARMRRDLPGLENCIHFNNAEAALPPQPVVEAAIGGYEAEKHGAASGLAFALCLDEGICDAAGSLATRGNRNTRHGTLLFYRTGPTADR
jgi:hypothetical protein